LEYEPELFYFWFDELLGYLLCADLFEKAEVCFKKFIATFEKEIGSGYALEKIAESYSCAHRGLGQIYQFKGQIDKAIIEYKKAIAIFPKGAYNHIILGEFFLKLNRINETISEYKKAIECDPSFAQYHKSLGDILLKNEDFIDALEAYRKAHEIWPDEKNFTKAYFGLKNSLDKSLYRKISDQHFMRGIDQQNVRIDTSHLPDLNNQIEMTELRLRKIISDSLDNDPSKLPPNIFQNLTDFIQREVKKNAVLDFRNYKSLSAMLEFSDIRDLQNIIIGKTNWPIFEMRFGNKERLNTKFDQFAELRNGIRHSRPVDKITHKEGEAAILWFEQVLNK
jgi:tetratricopeptide (TPR) repeat protein